MNDDDAPRPLPRPGRPPLLDDEMIKRVADIVRGGNYIETAAASAGISRSTLHLWLREGARIARTLDPLSDDAYDAAVDELTPHEFMQAKFSDTVQKAAAEAEVIDVLHVRGAASTHWQAAMTRLERRHPKRWGRREAVEVSGQLDGVHVNAETTEAAASAATVLQNARARSAAADLLEIIAGTNDEEGTPDVPRSTTEP